jgi:hypothetical protein
MGLYNNVILPRLCDLAMRNKHLLPYRQRVTGAAEGRVLEIGIGSGLNLPFYRNVREIIGLEPAPRLLAMARGAAERTFTPVTFIEGSASAIPIDVEASIRWSRRGPCVPSLTPRGHSAKSGAYSGPAVDCCSSNMAWPRSRKSAPGKIGWRQPGGGSAAVAI